MKRAMRFAVAKYTPDLHRMEPRNIGVVLWADGGAAVAKFMGEQDDGSLHIPALIAKDDRHAFKEWRTYWRHHLEAKGVRRRSGELVLRESAEFLDALREKSKEQFRLVDGGTFAETIAEKEMHDVLSELYDRIVERPEAQSFRAERAALADACKKAFEQTGISKRPDLQNNLPVPRHVHGVLRTFTADHALGPIGQPSAVLQRVLLTRAQSIDSNVLMFDALLGGKRPMDRENCAALVHMGHDLDANGAEGVKVLRAIVPVIDVSKSDAIAKLAALEARANRAI